MLRNDEGCITKFKDIPRILTEIGVKKLYSKDELLIAQGMEVDGLYVITNGKVMCTTYSENGKKKIHAILDVYSTFGVGHSINLFEALFDFYVFLKLR